MLETKKEMDKMEREQSSRIKEFRLFSGLSVDKLCVVLKVEKSEWLKWELGESPPLSLWLKITKYVMTQRLFFTSSTALSSEAADIVDMVDANTVQIKDSALVMINSENPSIKDAGRVILDNVNNIQKNLPKLYK